MQKQLRDVIYIDAMGGANIFAQKRFHRKEQKSE